MEIISRKEAKARGLTRYFTGKPCKRGHFAPRLASNGSCDECVKHTAALWNKANPEKRRAREKRYTERNPERRKEQWAAYRARNVDACRASSAQWRKENREASRVASRAWAQANEERVAQNMRTWRVAETIAAWRVENRDRVREMNMRRYASKIRAAPPWLTAEQIDEMVSIYEQAALAEELTGINHHVDHIQPLQGKDRCGLHVPWNLQILTAEENLSKGNRPVRHFHWKKL